MSSIWLCYRFGVCVHVFPLYGEHEIHSLGKSLKRKACLKTFRLCASITLVLRFNWSNSCVFVWWFCKRVFCLWPWSLQYVHKDTAGSPISSTLLSHRTCRLPGLEANNAGAFNQGIRTKELFAAESIEHYRWAGGGGGGGRDGVFVISGCRALTCDCDVFEATHAYIISVLIILRVVERNLSIFFVV